VSVDGANLRILERGEYCEDRRVRVLMEMRGNVLRLDNVRMKLHTNEDRYKL